MTLIITIKVILFFICSTIKSLKRRVIRVDLSTLRFRGGYGLFSLPDPHLRSILIKFLYGSIKVTQGFMFLVTISTIKHHGSPYIQPKNNSKLKKREADSVTRF